MARIKLFLWEDFLNSNRKKEEYNKNISNIGRSFFALVPDREKCWDFLTKNRELCLMMKNITNPDSSVLLHSFGDVGGSVMSLQVKKSAISWFNGEPHPVTLALDTIFSKVTVNGPVPNNLQKSCNHDKLTRFTTLYLDGLESWEMPQAIPVPPSVHYIN